MIFTQINLQHSKAATALLCKRLSMLHTLPYIITIQEPWVHNQRICGLGSLREATILYDERAIRPRTCLIVSNRFAATRLTHFCGQDLVAAKVSYEDGSGWKHLVVASGYFPYDSLLPPPPKAVVELVAHCELKQIGLILCCDANAQHTVWGSSKCNARGDKLFDFILTSNLNIHNVGNKPTFVTARRQEVIDLTLSNTRLSESISAWKVLKEDSLSDHRYIEFRSDQEIIPSKIIRNPRKTNWALFRQELDTRIVAPARVRSRHSTEALVLNLNSAIDASFERSCPAKKNLNRRPVPWWNESLNETRRDARKLLNRSLKTNLDSDWLLYRAKQKEYKNLIRKSKSDSYKDFCSSIESLSEAARLVKFLKRDRTARLDSLKRSDGSYTETKAETLRVLVETHFPGNQIHIGPLSNPFSGNDLDAPNVTRHSWRVARSMVKDEDIKYAIASFDGFKSPGLDGIYPAMLQEGIAQLLPSLKKIFRASLALAYIPTPWRLVRVSFIPKVGKDDYSLAKSFRPISMMSFVLKCLERLVELHIRTRSLSEHPLSLRQHAYQRGKSCETALQHLVGRIECAMEQKKYAMGIFVDIEGAFDNATFDGMCEAARQHGIDNTVVNWLRSMLVYRAISAEADCGRFVLAGVNRGCPQGGVLSPLLWCMLVDSLLDTLDEPNVYCQAYADDVAVLATGVSLSEVCANTQIALDKIDSWCTTNGLSVNPHKTGLVLFTKKRTMTGLSLPVLKGVTIPLSTEVKYLGLTLDSKLLWSKHVENKTSRALSAFWHCKGIFGKTWGLSPNKVLWIYTAMIRPMISYASVVWWNKVSRKNVISRLAKIQRTVCLGITGAFPTTPGAALNAILNLPPLDIFIKGEAIKACWRLKRSGFWFTVPWCISDIVLDIPLDTNLLEMPSDAMTTEVVTRRNFEVSFPDIQDWLTPGSEPGLESDRIFTDGSKTDRGSGAGVFVEPDDFRLHFALGEHASVFQAEVFAILKAMDYITEKRWSDRSISVCSDSQAALKALCNPLTSSKIVCQCRSRLNCVGRHNSLTLIWVPGHKGISGNEISDELARAGSDEKPLGPEPILGLPASTGKFSINSWVASAHKKTWQDETKCRFSKITIPKITKGNANFLLSLSRRDCRSLVGALTGHNACEKHMHVIGLAASALCSACFEEDGTTEHYLCECPAYSRLRMQIFGMDVMRMEQLHSLSPNGLLTFIKKSKKFQQN